MKIALIGYGEQGRAAYDYWHGDNEITVCDQNANLVLPEGVSSQLGPDYLAELDHFDLIVRSPIIHPRQLVAAAGETILNKTTTVTNEFFKVCPTRHIIGITGTKGKGTTSTLVAKMLEAAGKKVFLGGNLGIPPLDLLKQGIESTDWVVLELANFQLIDLKHSPALGVCLMVVSEHLDWHNSLDEYVRAKQQLFKYQGTDDIAIFFAGNSLSQEVASASQGIKLPYFSPPGAYIQNGRITIGDTTICQTKELKLLGRHNWQNICAAVTCVWQITQDVPAIREVATTFTGLEHRLQLIRELDGVSYYNDSFGTTPETAIVAIEALSQPKVVILGGSDKGADYSALAKTITNNDVRNVVLIGDPTHPRFHTSAIKIESALKQAGFNRVISLVRPGGVKMAEIVNRARQAARPGDVVILSTGSASFDLFKNYKDRGQQFIQAVQALV